MSATELLKTLAPIRSTLPDTNCLHWASSAARDLAHKGVDAIIWLVGDTWMLEVPGHTESMHMNIPIL